MKTRSFHGPATAAALLLGLAGCTSAPVAPENPNWTDDVYPIVQGNCASCHGPGGGQSRYDFAYDKNDMGCADLVTALNKAISDAAAKADSNADPRDVPKTIGQPSAALFKTVLTPDAALRMPPAPAGELPDWQRQVLEKWDGKRNRRDNNAEPNANTVALPKSVSGDTKFFVDVSDDDGDQVVGLVRIEDVTIPVLGVGRTTVALKSGDVDKLSSGKHDVNVDLCDGQTKVTRKVGSVQK
jgi:hypothetical protein